eukprot:TRINITY_DN10656_c0_g1_i1.p1 TRINITY_DN10656_c0_g1~~TRINITY_DN10656_c0_g1_i1.p1  ORF type:complete len:388 (+),score=89.73 TRINITY_DN10656_c0_g1_i1:188-1351(+)
MSTPAYNFSPGPGCLPAAVMKKAQAEFTNFDGSGFGVIETTNLDSTGNSHTEPRTGLQSMMTNTANKLRDLLKVPSNYSILFMHGGAVGQFSAIPLNLIGDNKNGADYPKIGYWSTRSIAEAEKYCSVHSPFKFKLENGALPPRAEWNVRKEAAFVHLCMNETVEGVEFLEDPEWSDDLPPLVADATSTLLSRPMDVSRYGLIYASGGKNLPAGVTTVIVRNDLLKDRKAHPLTPQIMDYRMNGGSRDEAMNWASLPNTPPTFSTYMLGLILDHIKETYVDLDGMKKKVEERASKIYHAIDSSGGFFSNTVSKTCRSQMNASFRINGGDRDLEKKFLDVAAEKYNLHYLFGHPVRGGVRVTMYIGIPDEAVDATVVLMEEFRKEHAS